MSQAERRAYPRLPYVAPMHIRNGGEHPAECMDVSESGLRFVTSVVLPPGTAIKVILFSRSMAVMAVCRHQRDLAAASWETGVEFLDRQPELLDVVRHQAPA